MSRAIFTALAIFLGTASALVIPPNLHLNDSSLVPSNTTSVPLSISSEPASLPSHNSSANEDPQFDALLRGLNSTNNTNTPKVIVDGQEYVVLLDPDQPIPPAIADILARVGLDRDSDVTYIFNNSAFRGFSGVMKDDHVDALNAMNEVKSVEASVKISSFATSTRNPATWGLERISQQSQVTGDPTHMNFQYDFDSSGSLGKGVDIYVVDTGINIAHEAFGGRAQMGFSMNGPGDLNASSDQDGHGTHVSGTAAGYPFGVASSANLIGVKVLGADGSGYTSDTIKGLDYVVSTHDANKVKPGFVGSIASMSWGLSGRSVSVEQAINAAVGAGVHVSVAAGNQGHDACTESPASTGGKGFDGTGGKAVAVGAVNNNDQISTFSNSGQCVDVYAPGEDVISAWIGSPTMVNILSGTSMACPHVTGLMAYLMAQNAALASSPASMKQHLATTSFTGQLSPQQALASGDLGLLINNGFKAAAKRDLMASKIAERGARDIPPVTLRW
jgi:cerevisin